MNQDPAMPSPAPAVRMPRRRWWRRFALGSAITLVVLLCIHLIWYVTARADLVQARAASAAAGLTEDPAQVIPPPCAEADNAAPRYQRAYGLLTLGGEPYVPGRSAGRLDPRIDALLGRMVGKGIESLIVSDGAAVLALLDHEDFRRAWKLVAEGARLPRCRFDNDWSVGPALMLPQLDMLRHFGRLGSLRARLLATQGRAQEAADQFADLLWMARQYGEEPIFLTLLCGQGMESDVLDNLRQTLEQPAFAAVDLQRVQLALSARPRAAEWKRALQGEFALFGCKAFHDPPTFQIDQLLALSNGESPAFWWFYASWLGAPLRANDEAAYHRWFAAKYHAPQSPAPDLGANWRHSLTEWLVRGLNLLHDAQDIASERTDAALLALHAASGGTPMTTATLDVERDEKGGWIISHKVKPGRTDYQQKKLQPWHIPSHP